MLEIYENTKKTHEKILKEQTDLNQHYENLEHNLYFSIENLRIETKAFIYKAYEEAKDKLILVYREDLKLLKSKLDWLPSNIQQISDLPPLEARIFILESRLRREETNRMQQKNEILKGDILIYT
jgi:hypothetical protein